MPRLSSLQIDKPQVNQKAIAPKGCQLKSLQLETTAKIMNTFLFKLIGLILLLVGVYFLGQNIIFTTQYSPYFWRDIPAAASVLALIGGMISLLLFPRETGSLGWILLIIGCVLVFLSGGVVLRPTSLWTFFVAFAALIGGFKLLTEGRVRF